MMKGFREKCRNFILERRRYFLLTALKGDGSIICLADLENRHSLERLKKQELFYCPGCKEKLILKIGTKKIPHFSHYRNNNCSDRFEKESNYHLLGKEKLYLWLKKAGLKPALEVFDHDIQQRPDICFHFQDKKFALEFQCSVIPDEVFIKRTRSYQENQYIPLWILGGNFFSRKNDEVITLSEFQYLTLTALNRYANIMYYCPNANRFILLQRIFPVTVRNAIASIHITPLERLSITDLLKGQPPASKAKLDVWQRQMHTFKQFFSLKQQAYRDPFLKELYRRHLHLALLPPEVGLPVANGVFIRTPPAIWQGFLFLDAFFNRLPGDVVSFKIVYQSFLKRLEKGHISIRALPLVNGDASLAVLEYLEILVACGYLTKLGDCMYKVNRKLNVSTNMVEQEQRERIFYQQVPPTLSFNDFG
jgi:competence protein CoiA